MGTAVSCSAKMEEVKRVLLQEDGREEYRKAARIITVPTSPAYGILPWAWVLAHHDLRVSPRGFNTRMIAKHVHGVVAVLDTTGRDRSFAIGKVDRQRFAAKTGIDLPAGNIAGLVVDLSYPHAFEWSDEELSIGSGGESEAAEQGVEDVDEGATRQDGEDLATRLVPVIQRVLRDSGILEELEELRAFKAGVLAAVRHQADHDDANR